MSARIPAARKGSRLAGRLMLTIWLALWVGPVLAQGIAPAPGGLFDAPESETAAPPEAVPSDAPAASIEEPLSPEVKLKPGDGYRFPEMWKIIELKDEVTSLKDARKAAKKVPRSPFDR